MWSQSMPRPRHAELEIPDIDVAGSALDAGAGLPCDGRTRRAGYFGNLGNVLAVQSLMSGCSAFARIDDGYVLHRNSCA